MQPAAKDPTELLLLLDGPGRRQLGALIGDVAKHMRDQLRPRERAPARVVGCCSAATQAFDTWRDDVVKRLRTLLDQRDTDEIRTARAKWRPPAVQASPAQAAPSNDLISLADEPDVESKVQDPADDVAALATLYQPLPTPLIQRPLAERTVILACILLLLLSAGAYSAYSRTLLLHLATSLNLPVSTVVSQETAIAATLIETASKQDMSAEAEAAKRKQQNQTARMWKVGLASVAGAAVIGITGGLAAPVVAGAIGGIMGGVGLGGVASFLGVFWMNGALVATLFGAFGAKMTGERMDRYAREVEDFSFVPLGSPADKTDHRLRVTIGVNGWLTDADAITRPWRALPPSTEVFALRYELAALMSLGTSLTEFATSYAWGTARNELLRRTVLASVWGALWPAALLSGAASAVDNPFAHALNRSTRAGKILADALANRVQGERPVTLVGFSLGASVVCTCLEELARRRVFGVVETVVLVGTPARAGPDYWAALATVVSGRIFNVFSDRDAMLGLLYRAHGLKVGIAGLQPISGVPRIENLNLSQEVSGHLRYPDLLPNILTRCGFPNVIGGQEPIAKDVEPPTKDAESKEATLTEEPSLIDLDVPPQSVPPQSAPPQNAPLPPLPTRLHRNNAQPVRSASSPAVPTDAILGIGSMSMHDSHSEPRPGQLQRIQSSFDYTHVAYGHESDDDDDNEGHAGIKMVNND